MTGRKVMYDLINERDALTAKVTHLTTEVERLGKEVEELMRVDYWQDRYNIIKKELEVTKIEMLRVIGERTNEILKRNEAIDLACEFEAERDTLTAKAAKLAGALERIANTRCAWQLSQEIAREALGYFNK